MSWIDGVRYRIASLLSPAARAREQDEELRASLELDAANLTHAGAFDGDAAARRRLGNMTLIREELYRLRTWRWVEWLKADIRHAWRGILRAPAFAAMIVLTIALGIGANTAMYSLLDRVFIRAPEGIAAPSEIRRLYVQAHDRRNPETPMVYPSFEFPHYREITAANPETPIVAYDTDLMTLRVGDASFGVTGAWVSPNFLPVLGVGIARGRHFGPDESHAEIPTPVAIISHELWQSRFGGDSAIIGRYLDIDKRPFTIVGVTQPGFRGVDVSVVDVFAPYNMEPAGGQLGQPWYRSFNASFGLLARLQSGVSEQQLLARARVAYGHTPPIPGFSFDTAATILAGPIVQARGPGRPQQEVSIGLRVTGVAVVLLLIACANVATLLVVRATRQRREIALRLALGASRARVYAQTLTESTLLALLGGAAAIAVCWWAGTALRKLLLPGVTFASGVLDGRVLAGTLIVSVVVGLVSGLGPIALARRQSVIDAMKAGARDGGYLRSRLRGALLVAQMALSVVLVIGSGLFVRSLGNVRAIRIGYAVDSVMFAVIQSEDEAVPFTRSLNPAAMDEIEARIAREPGVIRTARAEMGPMWGWTHFQIALPDRDSLPSLSGDYPGPASNAVSPGYFATTGMRVVSGRDFASGDSGYELIVNETMARTLWPGENAVGKCVILGRECSYVVGVVTDAHRRRILETANMSFFTPRTKGRTLVIRADPARHTAIETRLREMAKQLLAGDELLDIRRMTVLLDRELRPWRLGASLFVAFGVLAVLVAAIGVYSVIAYAVSQRTHELGVRIALGARFTDVVRLVVGEGMGVVAVGAAVGVGVALALGKLVAALLYGVTPRDPLVLMVSVVILGFVGGIASLIPAVRAAGTDPATALRAE